MNNFCVNCGKQLEPGENFCSHCGMQINQANNNQNQYIPVQSNIKPDGLSTAGFIIGIISLFINLFGIVGLLALILSCVGLGQTPREDKKGRDRATIGIVLGIIGIVWGIYQISKFYNIFY